MPPGMFGSVAIGDHRKMTALRLVGLLLLLAQHSLLAADAPHELTDQLAACAACHDDEGEGSASVSRPLRLASAVRVADPVNAINMVLLGGGPPSSDVHPLPPMMPPFAQRLSATEVAAVVSYVRRRFGADQRGVDAALVRSHAGAFLH